MDAAAILASVSIPRLSTVSSQPLGPAPPAVVRHGDKEPPSLVPLLNESDNCVEMPDALPVRDSFSPALSDTAAKQANLQTAMDSFPPPLSVSIDEQRGSIRMRIKTSVWNASTGDVVVSPVASAGRKPATVTNTQQAETISPIRV